jgi:hypothetical protein
MRGGLFIDFWSGGGVGDGDLIPLFVPLGQFFHTACFFDVEICLTTELSCPIRLLIVNLRHVLRCSFLLPVLVFVSIL